MRLLLRFCASCAFLRPSLLVLFAAFAGHLAAQPANVQADPTTGALFRPAAATFISGNSLLTTSAAAAAYQPLDADLTSWAAVVRAGGFDTFVATPSSANLASLVTGETGSGALVFGTSPTLTTPTLGAATATSLTAPASTDLTLAGGTSGASLVLGHTAGAATFNRNITVSLTPSGNPELILSSVTGTPIVSLFGTGPTAAVDPIVTFSTAGNLRFGTATGVGAAGASEKARVTNTGNLLIGTVTDVTGTGGLHVAGTGTATSSTLGGALRVGTNVALSGNATGASYFGGNVNAAGVDSQFISSGAVHNFSIGSSGAFNGILRYVTDNAVAWSSGVQTSNDAYVIGYGNGFGDPKFTMTALGVANFTNTTSASTSTGGALTIGNGTAATNVAIGGGNVNAGGSITAGNTLTVSTAAASLLVATGATEGDLILADSGAASGSQAWNLQSDGGVLSVRRLGDNFGTVVSTPLTINATGAATFAGAVTIAGTVIHTLSATPASATAAGTVGTMSWDANYIYICTATNTWKRVAIATW